MKRGELTNADSIHFADSLKCFTLRKHRLVYGGGGIMPDYFIPLDTTKYTKFHNEMAAKSVIITQSLKYIDSNRKALKKQYPTFDKFFTDYEIPQSYIDTVIKAAEKENIKPKDDEELKQTMPMLRMQLKALVARDIWDMSEYFHIINESSEFVQKALEVLR